uniref:Probable salivary secreted peptide isoform X4 n=1 Tax=Diabrotica virgifera virgifera TaxID=50390 RepID=A0A6P7GKZ3_DIAVI
MFFIYFLKLHWHGDQIIFCIMANSTKPASKGSTATITEGGLKHSFITIKLESGAGHGLEYDVEIYGKMNGVGMPIFSV